MWAWLRRRYPAALAAMGLGPSALPERVQDNGHCHVECRDGEWRLVEGDRGRALGAWRRGTAEEMLYALVLALVEDVARAEEAAEPDGRDPRRLRHTRELELLGRSDPLWRERRRREQEAQLAAHPWDDDGPRRRVRAEELLVLVKLEL